ncbi:hypothetical protein F5X68DRAFT_40673 [Plectosphaerella plurivora]|uniref:Uncharacterized protein n=1 Tax=Plectosphaerella plurivora TaxID=936078 RepID=A0A9P8V4I9_9PEZI|nr:hypothetical protein F5X68DRAFT_40673 [Plectosphaerella plurivora]
MTLAGSVGLRLETVGVWNFWVVFWSSTLDASDLLGFWVLGLILFPFTIWLLLLYVFCTLRGNCLDCETNIRQQDDEEVIRRWMRSNYARVMNRDVGVW